MELSVFCTSQFVIDKRIWNAYLSGLTVQQTIGHILKSTTVPQDQVQAVVTTQYRNFEMLEIFLHHPKQLSTQLIFSLNQFTKQILVHSYYRLDQRVIRELMGKKLTHRVRKELEDVATKTRTSVLGCKRMFDNLKRITKRVEDSSSDIVSLIMSHFLLSKELASQYAHIIFINTHRLDTTKRKLVQLKSTDFEYIASLILLHFSSSQANPLDELDGTISEDSRNLKTVFFNHKDAVEKYRIAVLQHLSTELADKCNANAFKVLLRNILYIGSSISNGKEFRDVFINLMERIVEPCVSFGWTTGDVEVLMTTLIQTFQEGAQDSISQNVVSKYSKSFASLVTVVQLSAIRLYPFCVSQSVFGF